MQTRRPTQPAAEEILGGYFPVLDHGFVALVDYMGSDEDIERAARVSYGFGTRKVSQTRGLIRYLRRHHHTTPSEMVELKFHCAMPMFVARQWIRHRTACLAEGTEIHFDLAGGLRGRGDRVYKLLIEEIFDRFQSSRIRTRPDNSFRRDGVRGLLLRQLNEETGSIEHTRVVDVYRNGRKPVFRMTLADGKSIEATADHRFLFEDGWSTLRKATGLEERSGRALWDRGDHFVHVNGVREEVPALYRDPVWPRRQYRVRSRLARVESFEYVGEKETYDLEVEGPYHNFVANGIVTHNSVNEYSGRYSLIPLLYYTPDAEHFALQSPLNNQGRLDEAAAGELYRGALERWTRVRGEASDSYSWLVGEDVARELARIDLPVSTYTQWYWKIDLHNLLHFLTLRVDPHAQYEIRAYAEVIAGMVKRVAPLSYEAWLDYGVGAVPLGYGERQALARLLEADERGIRARSEAAELGAEELRSVGLSPREIRELVAKLQVPERPDYELDLTSMRAAADLEAEMLAAVPSVDPPPTE